MNIPKAMLLDLDDTILANRDSLLKCWQSICERFTPQISDVSSQVLFTTIIESFGSFRKSRGRHGRVRFDTAEVIREVVAMAFARLDIDIPGLAEDVADTFTIERTDAMKPFPGAIEAVHHFRSQGIRLALVTNGNAQTQRPKIEKFGLGPLFDHILIEGEFGAGKPEKQVYLHALDQLGSCPEEAWMVGDNLELDVAVPQGLGIFSIWVDFAGRGLPPDHPIQPDRIIGSLSELVNEMKSRSTIE